MWIWSGQNIEATLFCFKDRDILGRMDFDTIWIHLDAHWTLTDVKRLLWQPNLGVNLLKICSRLMKDRRAWLHDCELMMEEHNEVTMNPQWTHNEINCKPNKNWICLGGITLSDITRFNKILAIFPFARVSILGRETHRSGYHVNILTHLCMFQTTYRIIGSNTKTTKFTNSVVIIYPNESKGHKNI